jgi:hypothetical protein
LVTSFKKVVRCLCAFSCAASSVIVAEVEPIISVPLSAVVSHALCRNSLSGV